MLLLGIDLGTSSIKVSVVEAGTKKCIASAQYPDTEVDIISTQPGWAEQSPELWWEHVQQAIIKCNATGLYHSKDIAAIGIAYQMHGLVLVDKEKNVLRNSIIWCDSRAVSIGEKAFKEIGQEKCLHLLLNSPGNFTASKLAWVKNNEPAIYEKIDKVMLPGDFIAMKLTGDVTTSIPALSEGIFWDYRNDELSKDVMNYYDLDTSFIPVVKNVFAEHGKISASIAGRLSLTPGVPVAYKAGDQPNNAFALNVLQPGEVAATAGTSGVIYAISGTPSCDDQSRINTFAHVNYTSAERRFGALLNINGTGILNRWIKNVAGNDLNYSQMNDAAQKVKTGSDGLMIFPFGNGAERMFGNKMIGAHIHNINFNIHATPHLLRAVQEGIAFAFRFGLDIMRENEIHPSVIRASKANMFLSGVFTEAFINTTNTAVEFYNTDGSLGAAIGAGLGAGVYSTYKDAFCKIEKLERKEPTQHNLYDEIYQQWKALLLKQLSTQSQ